MLDFLKPRHLRYRSVEEWRERENITTFQHPENPKLEVRLNRHLRQLRNHLWKKHLHQLTREERSQLQTGNHPSQSHRGFELAAPTFEEFRARVAALPYVDEVAMVTRHLQPIVFRVKLAQSANWRVWQEHIPPYYRGFEVVVNRSQNRKPALTHESAARLIPDGMSENDVYAILGTNARVAIVNGGQKHLSYLFQFPPLPPKVDPKIGALTVIVSKGVVTGRKFEGNHPV
jgi:hypothetical protein